MADNRNAQISRIIRTLLAYKGKSQVDLARHLDRSEATLSRRLHSSGDKKAQRPWRIDELDDVAAFFDVPVTMLLADPDELLKADSSWYEAQAA